MGLIKNVVHIFKWFLFVWKVGLQSERVRREREREKERERMNLGLEGNFFHSTFPGKKTQNKPHS